MRLAQSKHNIQGELLLRVCLVCSAGLRSRRPCRQECLFWVSDQEVLCTLFGNSERARPAFLSTWSSRSASLQCSPETYLGRVPNLHRIFACNFLLPAGVCCYAKAAALCDGRCGIPVSVLHTAGSHLFLLGSKDSGRCCTGHGALRKIASVGTMCTVGHCHFGSLC